MPVNSANAADHKNALPFQCSCISPSFLTSSAILSFFQFPVVFAEIKLESIILSGPACNQYIFFILDYDRYLETSIAM